MLSARGVSWIRSRWRGCAAFEGTEPCHISSGSWKRSRARRSRFVGRPAPGSRVAAGTFSLAVECDRRRQVLVERPRRIRRPAALGKARDLEHAHRAVERHRHHVAGTHGMACRMNTLAVDAHVAGGGERGSGAARAHHARVPQPFVDALAVQRPWLLLVRLELGLEGRELGERRVGIGLRLAPVATIAALDVFGAQFRIAVGTVAARWTAIAAMRPASAALVALRIGGTRRAGAALGATTLRPILAALAAVVATAPRPSLFGRGRGFAAAGAARRRLARLRRLRLLHRRQWPPAERADPCGVDRDGDAQRRVADVAAAGAADPPGGRAATLR